MPLERQHTICFDATPRTIEGTGAIVRNMELYPCGCYTAQVWRSIDPPEASAEMNAPAEPWTDDSRGELQPTLGPTGQILALSRAKPNGGIEGWYVQSTACDVHSGRAAVLSLALAARLTPKKMELWGDGAKQLYADREHVLARAAALDEELLTLGGIVVPGVDRQIAAVARAAGVPLLGAGSAQEIRQIEAKRRRE